MPYRPDQIEPRWQRYWRDHQTFVATERAGVPKFYALDMFPYPSGAGLHVGHPAGYTAGDVVSRYKRARGFNVLHPMGFDAFGLPAEQKAIDEGIAPQVSTAEAVAHFRGQLERLGFSYDWSREISTCDPRFYKWTQWIFTVLHARGLAYQAEMPVNWCPALGTVLANDEVIDGKSERGGHPVEQRVRRQWMLRTTAFRDRLDRGLDGLDWPAATKARQRDWLREMRDQVFARQRYWGEPIPVLKREGEVVRALTLDELPLELPPVSDYAPGGDGASALARATDWVHVTDPQTGQAVEREVDTMPGSAGSSWYFLRFCDPHNDREFCARAKSDYWMPVDLYIGGAEHTVGHLLYARAWQKALFDAGLVRDDEPFATLRHVGMVGAEVFYDGTGRVVPREQVEARGEQHVRAESGEVLTRRAVKMSKRLGNGVDPDDVVKEYGADALRVYLCFLGPLEADKAWQTDQLESQLNFLKRAWRLFFDGADDDGDDDRPRVDDGAPDEAALRVIHRAIAKVTTDIEALRLNTAVSALHVAVRDLTALHTRARAVLEPLAQLMAPFAPHFGEEVWARALGHAGGISFVPWPVADPRYVARATVTVRVHVAGRMCAAIELPPDASQDDAVAAALAHDAVARRLAGRAIADVKYKPGEALILLVG